MPERVAVIGAGIGGLSAALDLCGQGFEVEIFEQAEGPGGKMRPVMLGDSLVDAGPTVFTMRDVFEQLFADAGTTLAEHVTLTPLRTLARHAFVGPVLFDLVADVRQSSENVGRLSGPAEARRFLDFCQRAKDIYQTLDRTFMRAQRPSPVGLVSASGLAGLPGLMSISPFTTLWQGLGKYFHDERLRQLFGRYATYCGSSPFAAPATLMLVAHAEQDGVWAIDGGMHKLAEAMATLAIAKGARIRYNAGIKSIDIARGRVSRVTLDSGERIEADTVVFNGDAAALSTGLLGRESERAIPAIDPAQRSLSAMTWIARAQTSGFPLTRHNVFFSRDYKAEFDDIFQRKRVPREPTVYVCAQDRGDDGLESSAPQAPERLLILINAPATGDRIEQWETDTCRERTLQQLQRCGLTMTMSEDMTRVRTPTDFNRLYPATGGALYGQASHGWMASFKRPGSRSSIPGLYLAGGSVHPGPGVPMAALSGRLAAQAILQDRVSTTRSRATAMPGGMSMR